MSENGPQSRPIGGKHTDVLELAPAPAAEEPSSYADDPMTRLWQNAQDRETGVEAVEAIEAIRARRRNPGDSPSKRH